MPEPQIEAELELRDYLRVLNRRRWTVAAAVAVVFLTAVVSSVLQVPVYEGTAEVLLQNRATESLFDANTGQRIDPARVIDTEIQVLRSAPVEAEVRRKLGRAPRVSAAGVGQTDVIRVRARSTDPEQAALVANAYATSYIEFRRKQAVDDLFAAGQQLQVKIDSLQQQIAPLTQQISEADEKNRASVEARVQPQIDSLVGQQALFKQKLDQLQVDAALKTGGAQLVTPASPQDDPVEPNKVRSAIVALVVGAMFGIALAFAFDYLDDSIKTKEDVERATPGLPVLGLIPAVTGWRDRDDTRLISRDEPMSPTAEAYRSLRTSVQFLGLDRPVRTILITSANAGEGKSTTVSNLAVALGRAGQEVIVVDCDLRRPRVHQFFGVSNAMGFTSVLLGETPLSGALQRVSGEERVRVLASGPLPPNPSELLSSPRSAELFGALRRHADVVLIDASPVLPVTDAAVLAAQIDTTLLVVAANNTTRKQAARAIEILSQVDAHVAGTILNGVKDEGGYGYAYGYHKRDEPSARRRAHQRVSA